LAVLLGSSTPLQAGTYFYETNGGNQLIRIDTATGAYTTVGALGYSNTWASAFDDQTGTYYAFVPVSGGCQAATVGFNGAATPFGSLYVGAPCPMAIEIGNSGPLTFYMASDFGAGSFLVSLNLAQIASGTYPTWIGTMGFPSVMDLAFDSQGTLYAVASPGGAPDPYPAYSDIYKVSTSNGQWISTTRIWVPGLKGLAFDASDTLYATSVRAPGHPLYTINLANGTATEIGPTGAGFPQGGDIDLTGNAYRFGGEIPEPGAWLTVSSGLLAVLAIRRRARRDRRPA
jgi:hypothetical protein